MAASSPTRKALNNLSVNTHGSPHVGSARTFTNTTLKRSIQDVDCFQPPPPASRLCLALGTERKEESTQRSGSLRVQAPQAPQTTKSPTTNAMVQDEEEGDSEASSRDSATTSTDIDPMDDTLASQQTAATETSQPGQSAVNICVERLRLRLQLAMFKIQTNQTNLPVSQLRIPSKAPHSQHLTSTPSPEQTVSVPRLLPAPELKPTAYSARMIPQAQLPSSPPSSRKSSPDSNIQEEVFRTPALPKKRTQATDLQLSSPPDSDGGKARLMGGDDSITSSAVRGSVAMSLLGMAHTGR